MRKIAVLLALSLVPGAALATKPKPEPTQVQGQMQGRHQEADANAHADASSDAVASVENSVQADGGAASSVSSNEGNEFTVEGDSVENNSSNVVLVPNNNTESCVRVWGLAFGKNGESGALGIPWRSKKCDFEQAADDAFAAGERELGWFWKCQNPNLYKVFKSKNESKESAKQDCHEEMVGEVSNIGTIAMLEEKVLVQQNELVRVKELHRTQLSEKSAVCDESINRATEACKK